MWTVFRNVARAGGSVVADPECLRLRDEDEMGDDDEPSDDIIGQKSRVYQYQQQQKTEVKVKVQMSK